VVSVLYNPALCIGNATAQANDILARIKAIQ